MVTQSMPEFSLWRRSNPPPGSRIKPEGVDNYQKNRGSLHRVVFQQVAPSSSATFTPRPVPRCPSSASKVNYQLGVHGNVGKVLKGADDTPRPSSAPPRVKPEAEGIATLSKGTRIRPILHEPASGDGCTPPPPRVKPEGEVIASISKGKRMNTLIHEYAQHEPSPRQARVKEEAADTAEVAKGKRMRDLMHKYATIPLTARAMPRVKREAEENAALDRGKRMDTILHKYGSSSSRSTLPRRVKQEGESNADLDRGKRMASLLQSAPSGPQVPARRVKPEAARSADLGQGPRMAKLLHETQSAPRDTPRPCRAVGEQAKRNLWRGVIGTVGKCLKHTGRTTCIFLPGQQRRQYSATPCVV